MNHQAAQTPGGNFCSNCGRRACKITARQLLHRVRPSRLHDPAPALALIK